MRRSLRSHGLCACLCICSAASHAEEASGQGAAASPSPIRVALYQGPGTGGGGPPALRTRLHQPPRVLLAEIAPDQIQTGGLSGCDVVIFAGGSASKQAAAIGEAGMEAVRRFVAEGGGYVGICAGAYLALSGSAATRLGLVDAVTVSPKWKRGKGRVQMELSGEGRKLMGPREGMFPVHYCNGPVVKPAEREELADYEVLAWFRTELSLNGTPPGIMTGAPAVLAGTFGRGRAVCVSPHPEQTQGLEHLVPSLVTWAAGTGKPAPAQPGSLP